jgi:hypothetical protein
LLIIRRIGGAIFHSNNGLPLTPRQNWYYHSLAYEYRLSGVFLGGIALQRLDNRLHSNPRELRLSMHFKMSKISLFAPLLLIFYLLVGARLSPAQLQAGRIVGQITDPLHALIPGATVRVKNTATGVSWTVKTSRTGDYTVTPLDPGIYSVTVTAQGFETTVKNGVELTVGQSVAVDLQVLVGTMNTQVIVSNTGPTLNTESGAMELTVSNQDVVDLPLNGRQFTQLAELSPGVAPLPATGNTQNVRPEELNGNVIDGINGQETDFLLDGADITEHHEGGTYIQTSIDALQEFNVEESPYTSEFPGVGAAFNSTTKSGTNRYDGDLFEFLRNDIFDGRNYFALVRNTLKRDQFGGTIGGPITIGKLYNGKDRTFFFASYEGERQLQGNVTDTVVPTAAQRSGDFSASNLNPIYDPVTTMVGSPTTRQQFQGNMIPQGRISPVATYFDKLLPTDSLPGTAPTAIARQTLQSSHFWDPLTFKVPQPTLKDRLQVPFARPSPIRSYSAIFRASTGPRLTFRDKAQPWTLPRESTPLLFRACKTRLLPHSPSSPSRTISALHSPARTTTGGQRNRTGQCMNWPIA